MAGVGKIEPTPANPIAADFLEGPSLAAPICNPSGHLNRSLLQERSREVI